jgi:hypothetical protein
VDLQHLWDESLSGAAFRARSESEETKIRVGSARGVQQRFGDNYRANEREWIARDQPIVLTPSQIGEC